MISFIKALINIFMNIDKINYFKRIDFDLMNNIILFLNINELESLSYTHNNCELNRAVKPRIEKLRDCNKFFNNLKRHKIVKYFEGTFLPLNLVNKLPIIDFQRRFVGATDYIDRIRFTDMPSPIMIGVDFYDRPFICIKYVASDEENEDISMGAHILTVFQRYTDNKRGWTKAGTFNGPILMFNSGMFNKVSKRTFIKNIYQLLNREKVTCYDFDYLEKEIDCYL